MALMTVADWAISEGITKPAAYKRLLRVGVTPKNGLIESDVVNAKWADVRDDDKANANPDGKAKGDASPNAGDAKTSLGEAQRARAWLKVKTEQMNLAVKQGRLIDRDEINSKVLGMITVVKNRIMSVPDELAEHVAIESDPIRCRELIKDALREALSQLRPASMPDVQ